MKLKMFLRGFGSGILLCALVLFTAFMTDSTNNMTDEEIINKAKELGMVESSDDLSKMFNNKNTSSVKENSKDDVKKDDTTEVITDTSTKDTTDTSTKDTTEVDDTETTSKDLENKNVEVEFQVSRGMTSTAVARILQDVNVIKDYKDFDEYLQSNGYSHRISTGTFKVKEGDSYEDIAKTICR